jgi:putative transposase
VLPLPTRFRHADIRQVELVWRADHYELALTIVQPAPDRRADTSPQPPGQIAGVDMGEIHLAAICTEDGHALVVSGRRLRHQKQLRNKRHVAYRERIDRCRKGSRRWRRLKQQMARASAKLYRQQRDLMHQSSRKVIAFAIQHGVTELAIGDVRDIADGVALGRQTNQKVSQWSHGQLRRYLTEKGARAGMTAPLEDEAYSTRTCSRCGQRLAGAPRGRVFTCPGCSAVSHRDANAAANICSKRVYGTFGRVQVWHLTHRRAIAVRAATSADVAGRRPRLRT